LGQRVERAEEDAMSLEERLAADAVDAMRRGDDVVRRTLGMVRAALKNAAIEARGALDEAAVERVLAQQAKMRRDAIAQFQAAGREDLVASERAELTIIEGYLPEQLDDAALESAVREVIAQVGAEAPGDVGRVMGPAMAAVRGRADGKRVSEVVRRLLAG